MTKPLIPRRSLVSGGRKRSVTAADPVASLGALIKRARRGGARPGTGPKPKPLSQLKYPPRRPTVKPRPLG